MLSGLQAGPLNQQSPGVWIYTRGSRRHSQGYTARVGDQSVICLRVPRGCRLCPRSVSSFYTCRSGVLTALNRDSLLPYPCMLHPYVVWVQESSALCCRVLIDPVYAVGPGMWTAVRNQKAVLLPRRGSSTAFWFCMTLLRPKTRAATSHTERRPVILRGYLSYRAATCSTARTPCRTSDMLSQCSFNVGTASQTDFLLNGVMSQGTQQKVNMILSIHSYDDRIQYP